MGYRCLIERCIGAIEERPSLADLYQSINTDHLSHRLKDTSNARSNMEVQFNERSVVSSLRNSQHVAEEENTVPITFCKVKFDHNTEI